MKAGQQVFRACIFHCLCDPGSSSNEDAFEYFEDGILIVENGLVTQCGPAEDLLSQLPNDTDITDYSGKLLVPGFIDCHLHYPQIDMIASYGEQLLTWLNKYTFPTEAKFDDPEHAGLTANFFLDELLRNGTTSALVMPTVHPASVEAIFSASQKRNMRIISGKVLMDRHGPEGLLDTPQTAYQQSKELLERWHKQDRLLYAITPRFAPASSEQQLSEAGRLAKQFPDTYIHSHVAENKQEVDWVAKLFPWSRSYLDVYDNYGLLRERAIFAHGIHLNGKDQKRLHETGAALAFCPTSNLFLGSGLFDLKAVQHAKINIGLASDVGAGTSFSMLQTLCDAYKIQQLLGNPLPATQGVYLATLAGAKTLCIEDKLGNFLPGKEADFIVLDYRATPLIERRLALAKTIEEKLFALMILGDDRAVTATHIMGQCIHTKQTCS